MLKEVFMKSIIKSFGRFRDKLWKALFISCLLVFALPVFCFSDSAEAEQGDAEAQYNLGIRYLDGGDHSEAFKWLMKAANKGHVDAQYALAGLYKDEQERLKWYLKAAENGHIKAQYALGTHYYNNGSIDNQNNKEAFKWFMKAAEQGDAQAQNSIGIIYLRIDERNAGLDKQDLLQAIKWFQKAAEQKDQEAKIYLIGCYVELAKRGDAEYQYIVGSMYEDENSYSYFEDWRGVKIGQDLEEAIKWYKKAAAQGHVGAKEALERIMN